MKRDEATDLVTKMFTEIITSPFAMAIPADERKMKTLLNEQDPFVFTIPCWQRKEREDARRRSVK